MTTADRCAHDACLCTRPYDARNLAMSTTPTDPHAEFCSPRCATQQRNGSAGDDGCECGHPQCTSDPNTPDIPPMQ